MITSEKIKELATQLLEKSQSNEVNWQVGEDKIYYVRFPTSALGVHYYEPSVDPDYIAVEVYDDQNTRVAAWDVYEGDDDWDLVSGLYRDADRCVRGWDKALADVEKALNMEGPVGVPSADADIPL